jgi:hypothetical protein
MPGASGNKVPFERSFCNYSGLGIAKHSLIYRNLFSQSAQMWISDISVKHFTRNAFEDDLFKITTHSSSCWHLWTSESCPWMSSTAC